LGPGVGPCRIQVTFGDPVMVDVTTAPSMLDLGMFGALAGSDIIDMLA